MTINFILEPSCSPPIIPKIPRKKKLEVCSAPSPFRVSAKLLGFYPKACLHAKRRALFSFHTNIHCGSSAGKSLALPFLHAFLSSQSPVLEETLAWLCNPSRKDFFDHSYCQTEVSVCTILVPASVFGFSRSPIPFSLDKY